ncbi:hypothetical protein BGZ94_004790, partial [Podila epigama]
MSYAEYKYGAEYNDDEKIHSSPSTEELEDEQPFSIRVDKTSDFDMLPMDNNTDSYEPQPQPQDNQSQSQPKQQQQQHKHQHQHQYPPNHYGYDIQQFENERKQRQTRDNHTSGQDTIENVSEAILAPLPHPAAVAAAAQPVPQHNTSDPTQERPALYRATIATDSAVSLSGDDIIQVPHSTTATTEIATAPTASPSSSPPGPTLPASDLHSNATYANDTSTKTSRVSTQQPRSRSGSLSAASVPIGSRMSNGHDTPVPPLPSFPFLHQTPLQHHALLQQQQQRSTPSGRGVIVNINPLPCSAQVVANPPSPGKTGWEREVATPTTPAPSHQHSSSLFDFFRTRKQSISKNGAHQAAAAAAATAASTSATANSGSTAGTGTGTGIGTGTAAATSSSSSTVPSLPANLPFMGTPPTISKSRMGPHPHYPSHYAPTSSMLRKQSLDSSVFRGYPSYNTGNQMTFNDRHTPISTNVPSTTTFTNPPSNAMPSPRPSFSSPSSASTPDQPATLTHTAHSTFSKVAAAVVGVTVGRRRPSVTAEILETGQGGPPKHDGNTCGSSIHPVRKGLDASQLENHAKFLSEAKTTQELTEYIEQLYHTILTNNVALEYSNKQMAALQKELDQTKSQAEEEKKALTAETQRVKEQVATMEENFLLWRNKVHSDQVAAQEEYLHERLLKQDRIEELEEDLFNSKEEVTRLRNRLLVLEYEDGYIGPTSFLSDYTSFSKPPEIGPMTVANHKRRSADFKMLEQQIVNYEHKMREFERTLEAERQGHQKEIVDFRLRMHSKVAKLEEQVQAAK